MEQLIKRLLVGEESSLPSFLSFLLVFLGLLLLVFLLVLLSPFSVSLSPSLLSLSLATTAALPLRARQGLGSAIINKSQSLEEKKDVTSVQF